FVALQVTDEVPRHRNVDQRHLLECFLDPVLTDVVNSSVPRRSYGFRPVRLGDGHDLHLLTPPSPDDCFGDPPSDLRQPRGKLGKKHKTLGYLRLHLESRRALSVESPPAATCFAIRGQSRSDAM